MHFQKQDFEIDNDEYVYLKPDTHVLFHEDDEILQTMRVDLPVLEEFYSKHLGREVSYEEACTLVDGYGFPRGEQRFKYTELTENIKNLYKNVASKKGVLVKEIKQEMLYAELESERINYKDDLLFIQREIFRRFNGYWFYNNGKPTYITGWHYFFLNYWKLNLSGENKNRPYYRDKQRRQALFYEWAFRYSKKRYSHRVSYRKNGKYEVKHFNDNNAAIEFEKSCKEGGFGILDRGVFEVENIERTLHGLNQPKSRREGFTSFVCCSLFLIITEGQQMNCWILGQSEDDSKDKIFQGHMVEAISKLPFFFVPFHDNDKYIRPSSEYVFNYPTRLQLLETSGVFPESVGSVIRPFTNSYRKIDGTRAGTIYFDEVAKPTEQSRIKDVNIWWSNVAKKTLQVGNRIVGFAFNGSTVADMTLGGGECFKALCDKSHAYSLNNNGTTISGLVNLFFPAYDGLEGFIDKHGMSVIEDPLAPTFDEHGRPILTGARTYLNNERDGYLKSGDITAYINETREMPQSWKECWTPSVNNSGFPIIEMRKRHSEIMFSTEEQTWGTYRLEWINGTKLGSVEIIPDENGGWVFLKEFLKKINQFTLNKKVFDYREGSWMMDRTLEGRSVIGVDPFRFDEDTLSKSKSKRSKGAIALFYPYDKLLDENKIGSEQLTEDYMGFFHKRTPTKEEFNEEVAKAAILFGSHLHIEKNEPRCYEQLVEWKMGGYMIKLVNVHGDETDETGATMTSEKHQTLFTEQELFFKRNCYRTKLPQLLDVWMRIPSPKKFNDFDLCAASAWALEGAAILKKKGASENRNYGNYNGILPC